MFRRNHFGILTLKH